MRVLLDTHALYWYVEGDRQLSATAESVIRDASNEVLIRPASFSEIAIKVSIGKCHLNRPFEKFIDIGLRQYGFQLLPIQPSHTARLIGLPFYHKDPFDRLLVAQTLSESISIVSDNVQLDAYGITRIW